MGYTHHFHIFPPLPTKHRELARKEIVRLLSSKVPHCDANARPKPMLCPSSLELRTIVQYHPGYAINYPGILKPPYHHFTQLIFHTPLQRPQTPICITRDCSCCLFRRRLGRKQFTQQSPLSGRNHILQHLNRTRLPVGG